MRLALFADVHGNPWALESILRAIRREKPDQVIFLGDALLRVPAPKESIELIRSIPHISIRGNYDWFVIGGFPGQERRFQEEPFLPDEIAWTKEQLSADDLKYLDDMPLTVRLFEGTPQEVVLCHASPGKAFGGIFPPPEKHDWGMTDDQVRPLLEGESAPTVLCAHTHAVMDRRIDRYRVINPGSVSLGWNQHAEMDAYARWALITWNGRDWDVDFRAEAYPTKPVWDAYLKWPLWPMVRNYPKPKWWGEKAEYFANNAAAARSSS